VKSLLSIGRR